MIPFYLAQGTPKNSKVSPGAEKNKTNPKKKDKKDHTLSPQPPTPPSAHSATAFSTRSISADSSLSRTVTAPASTMTSKKGNAMGDSNQSVNGSTTPTSQKSTSKPSSGVNSSSSSPSNQRNGKIGKNTSSTVSSPNPQQSKKNNPVPSPTHSSHQSIASTNTTGRVISQSSNPVTPRKKNGGSSVASGNLIIDHYDQTANDTSDQKQPVTTPKDKKTIQTEQNGTPSTLYTPTKLNSSKGANEKQGNSNVTSFNNDDPSKNNSKGENSKDLLQVVTDKLSIGTNYSSTSSEPRSATSDTSDLSLFPSHMSSSSSHSLPGSPYLNHQQERRQSGSRVYLPKSLISSSGVPPPSSPIPSQPFRVASPITVMSSDALLMQKQRRAKEAENEKEREKDREIYEEEKADDIHSVKELELGDRLIDLQKQRSKEIEKEEITNMDKEQKQLSRQEDQIQEKIASSSPSSLSSISTNSLSSPRQPIPSPAREETLPLPVLPPAALPSSLFTPDQEKRIADLHENMEAFLAQTITTPIKRQPTSNTNTNSTPKANSGQDSSKNTSKSDANSGSNTSNSEKANINHVPSSSLPSDTNNFPNNTKQSHENASSKSKADDATVLSTREGARHHALNSLASLTESSSNQKQHHAATSEITLSDATLIVLGVLAVAGAAWSSYTWYREHRKKLEKK